VEIKNEKDTISINNCDNSHRKAELSRQMTIIRGSQRQQMANILSAEQLATMNKMRDSRKGGIASRQESSKQSKRWGVSFSILETTFLPFS